MAFPPEFLDELRARVGLADVIARRVKLTRKGREHSGLCPFHSEKTPSFTISEEKGFYHCFGCGAHGDVIGFVMRTEGLAFPEAVERLAAEAGIQVPVSTPAERQRAQARATLLQVMEAACIWFEGRLRAAGGAAARDYLAGRGIDDDTIARFRLGFAPNNRSALKTALMGETARLGGALGEARVSEAQLVDAGLLIRPEDGGATYDRFRGRVTFPITDLRGRVIAFGARTLGDGQPKYLNSPDTPLFNKGRVLYGMATARRAAHDTGRVIVCEGYTDVIALARAGIAEAVAPLGTAITESQIALLWRMAPEPILCLDGDEAGQRAAARAAERALPLLKPGNSLLFATLPAGQDPDSLIAAGGAAAIEEVLATAGPLDQVVWRIETAGKRLDTPERRAGLEQRLEKHAFAIADRKVQQQYLAQFRQRLWALNRGARGIPGRGAAGVGAAALLAGQETSRRRREQVLAATVVNHISILDQYLDDFGEVVLSDPILDKLRQEILMKYASEPRLDSQGLKRHLLNQGFADILAVVLGPEVYGHGGFARPEAGPAAAGAGFRQLVVGLSAPNRAAQLAEAEKAYADDPSEETLARLIGITQQRIELSEGLTAESEDSEETAAIKSLSP